MTRSDQVKLVLFADDMSFVRVPTRRTSARGNVGKYLRVLIYNLVLLTAELEQVGPALVEYLEQPARVQGGHVYQPSHSQALHSYRGSSE